VARREHAPADHQGPENRQAPANGADLRPERRAIPGGGVPGRRAKDPSWYLNLTDDPEVELQVGADRFPARARTATAEEKPGLWRIMISIWPDYDRYQARCERDIPVVILERLSSG